MAVVTRGVPGPRRAGRGRSSRQLGRPRALGGERRQRREHDEPHGTLRSGDYQIGLNGFRPHGYPALVSLYRDATFKLAHSHIVDAVGRPTNTNDRLDYPISSAAPPSNFYSGTAVVKQFGWSSRTEAPVMTLVSAGAGNDLAYTEYAQNVQLDDVRASWPYGVDTATRDAAGRVVKVAPMVINTSALYSHVSSFATETHYRPDGRIGSITDVDGVVATFDPRTQLGSVFAGEHAFTYDERGLVATSTSFEGTYRYAYDALGRNTELVYPDGHRRVQSLDDRGRVTSRCYVYPDGAAPDRCYGAIYDAVGNPVQLSDPEGTDTIEYDALDRLSRVSRNEGGVV